VIGAGRPFPLLKTKEEGDAPEKIGEEADDTLQQAPLENLSLPGKRDIACAFHGWTLLFDWEK
jgi:hypothetical protein